MKLDNSGSRRDNKCWNSITVHIDFEPFLALGYSESERTLSSMLNFCCLVFLTALLMMMLLPELLSRLEALLYRVHRVL